MDHSELTGCSALDLARLIRDGEVSPVEAVDAALARIRVVNPVLNAFCAVYAEEARAAAGVAERAVRDRLPLGPLHGVPIAIKDFTPLAGKTTTRGSLALRDWVPQHDPVIVRRLRSAGAIIVARTTTPELAFSSFTESPCWGITRNPWDPGRTSGGSSGGSAVAVATGCVALAEGTDMGGSVRIPAALCGVVGLKPSLGRIPMDILPTVFDSMAHFGPLARSIDDAALFVMATQGPDDADIQSLAPLLLAVPVERDLRQRAIALSIDLGFFHVHPEIAANTYRAADALRSAGALVEEVRLPWTRAVVDAWFAHWGVFQAAHFGELLSAHRSEMDPQLVRLMERGLAMSAVGFKQLEHVRTQQWRGLADVFARFDMLLCPTMARPAPPVGMDDSDFDADDEAGRYMGLDMTCPFNNIAQCPALTLPSGFTADGLPTGVQIVGRRFDDVGVLEIGAVLENALALGVLRPPV